MAGQPSAGSAQRCHGHSAGCHKPGAGVGSEACHRRGLRRDKGLNLCRRGHNGGTHTVRLRAQHSRNMDTQHSRHKGAEPHAAADARPNTALRMARTRDAPLRRRAQPPGIRREQRHQLPHRNNPQHSLGACDVHKRLHLSVLHGQGSGTGHRGAHTHFPARQQGVRGTHAPSDTSRARFRQQGAERLAGDCAAPHAHKDARERRRND